MQLLSVKLNFYRRQLAFSRICGIFLAESMENYIVAKLLIAIYGNQYLSNASYEYCCAGELVSSSIVQPMPMQSSSGVSLLMPFMIIWSLAPFPHYCCYASHDHCYPRAPFHRSGSRKASLRVTRECHNLAYVLEVQEILQNAVQPDSTTAVWCTPMLESPCVVFEAFTFGVQSFLS